MLSVEKPGTPEELVLQHHGVLGMRWGHRKATAGGTTRSQRRAAKRVAKGEAKFTKNVSSARQNKQLKIQLHNSVTPVINSKVHRINAKPEYLKAAQDGTLKNPNSPITKRYIKEVNKTYLDSMNDYLSGYKSPGGTRQLRAHEAQGEYLNFSLRIEPYKAAQHDDAPMVLKIEYVRDDSGLIVGFNVVDDEMAQSAIDGAEFIEDVLQHYGVPGMHWGHRKEVFNHSDIAHIPRGTRKEASKDAEEHTRAKLYFGEGAGTRRKLIKATVESKRKKDPLYGQAFDHFVKHTDLGQRALQARRQRRRTDRATSVRKTTRGVGHVLRGNSQYANTAAVAGVAAGTYAYKKYNGQKLVNDLLKKYS